MRKLLSIDDLCKKVGGESKPVNPSTVYRLVKAGKLPKPIKIAPGISRWDEREADESIDRLAEARA